MKNRYWLVIIDVGLLAQTLNQGVSGAETTSGYLIAGVTYSPDLVSEHSDWIDE